MTASVPARLSLALLLASLLASPPLAATASVPGAARPPRIANGSGPTPTYLPTADAAALASGDADRTVRDAFLGPDAPGAMLVRGVPGYARARADALRSLALCAASPEGRDAFVSAEAWERDHGDGLFSKMSVAAPADGRLPVELDRACGAALRPKLEALRAAADAAATAVLPRLDELLGYDTGGFFAAAAKSSSSLDHFHVYAPSASAARVEASDGVPTDTRDQRTVSQRDRNTVDDVGVSSDEAFGSRTHAAGKREHVDVGVAIVMTPAFLVNGDVSVSSRDEALERFSEELDAFGSRGLTLGGRAPELPPDALIVMLGEAARAWAPPPPKGASAADAVAVPTHAMALALARGRRRGAALVARVVRAHGAPPRRHVAPHIAGNHLRRVARGRRARVPGRRGRGRSARRWRRFRVRRGGAWRTTRAAAPARCTAGWRAWRTPRAVAARTRC